MAFVGQLVIYIMMFFLLLGALAHVIRPASRLGLEFKEGIATIGHIFIPIAGIMCLIPVLVPAIQATVAPLYRWMHSDPSIAVGTFIPSDLGSYALGFEVASSHGAWIQSLTIGLTAGATLAFSIPVGLAMMGKRDQKYLALGFMSGLLAIPFASLIMCLVLMQTGVLLREDVNITGEATKPFDLPLGSILLNVVPLVVIMGLLALSLRFFPNQTIRMFLIGGRALQVVTTLALAVSVVEYFTGVFSTVFGSWPLAPFIADSEDQFRALEIVGYIGVMLAGAFPMVYCIRIMLARPLGVLGRKVGVSEVGITGFIAATANVLALYRVVPMMPAKDKVLTVAYAVCAAFALGDYIAFTANFQPNMIVAMLVGKVGGGLVAVLFAIWLALPVARRLELEDDLEDQRLLMEQEQSEEGIAQSPVTVS